MTSENNAPATQDELLAILGSEEFNRYSDDGITRHPATGRILTGPDGADDLLNVEFSTEAVFNKLLTHRAGGVPKYVDMDFITISAPGDVKLTVHTPVTEYYKWRFPVEYRNFKEGQAAVQTGTPLMMWPLLTQTQIKEMTYLGLRTVEQVANMADSNSGQFAGFYALKTQAKQFLKLATDKAESGKLQAELDQRDKAHAADMAAMKAQIDALMKQLLPVAEDKPAKQK